MSIVTAVPEGIKDRECERFAIRDTLLYHMYQKKIPSKKWSPC